MEKLVEFHGAEDEDGLPDACQVIGRCRAACCVRKYAPTNFESTNPTPGIQFTGD
jgi:hypothetical protein